MTTNLGGPITYLMSVQFLKTNVNPVHASYCGVFCGSSNMSHSARPAHVGTSSTTIYLRLQKGLRFVAAMSRPCLIHDGRATWHVWTTSEFQNFELSAIQPQVQWCLLSDWKVASQTFHSATGWCRSTKGLNERVRLNMEQNCLLPGLPQRLQICSSLQVKPTEQQLTLAHGLKMSRAKWQRIRMERLGQQQGSYGRKSIVDGFSMHSIPKSKA